MKKQINLLKTTSTTIDGAKTISELAALLESILNVPVEHRSTEAMLNITSLIRSIASVMPRVEVDCEFKSVGKDYDTPNF